MTPQVWIMVSHPHYKNLQDFRLMYYRTKENPQGRTGLEREGRGAGQGRPVITVPGACRSGRPMEVYPPRLRQSPPWKDISHNYEPPLQGQGPWSKTFRLYLSPLQAFPSEGNKEANHTSLSPYDILAWSRPRQVVWEASRWSFEFDYYLGLDTLRILKWDKLRD